VYASTSGRRMDAAKGPRERPVYPALCWAVDDFAEVGTIYYVITIDYENLSINGYHLSCKVIF